jgi:hypothetical protein
MWNEAVFRDKPVSRVDSLRIRRILGADGELSEGPASGVLVLEGAKV